ncbi:MAG: hypothetical protein JNK30_02245 [Phenylobacterium sp.]|uniref:hypothetical protein n=1 Tax=Phenylobacterium sp. TaxID=1871053 RepID=UPI001A57CF3F|nr:hypothetical protein [Phenylobacterium sp.]MBL8770177.1 hypothetical protein [Phenylobacterium sp.]
MGLRDSALDPDELSNARSLLQPAVRRDRAWPALLAALALAVTSVLFASAMVLAPPVTTNHAAQGAPD